MLKQHLTLTSFIDFGLDCRHLAMCIWGALSAVHVQCNYLGVWPY